MRFALIWDHLFMVFWAVVFSLIIGLPLGVLTYFYPKARKTILWVVDLFQTIPSLALLGIIMHLYPDESRVGKFLFRSGPLTTSVDLYDVSVKGKGGHGSAPHTTHDPILAACQMVTLLQQIPARYVDPLETVIFPVCSIHSGDAPNIIPDEAKFSGIARAYVDSVRKTVDDQVYQIARGIESISGCKIEINHYEGYPACYNDPELTKIAQNAVGGELGEESVIAIDNPLSFSEDFSYYTKMTGTPGTYMKELPMMMGSEDFAYYSKVPSVFGFLGSRDEKAGLTASNHNDHYTVPESVLKRGTAFYAQFAADYLAKNCG